MRRFFIFVDALGLFPATDSVFIVYYLMVQRDIRFFPASENEWSSVFAACINNRKFTGAICKLFGKDFL